MSVTRPAAYAPYARVRPRTPRTLGAMTEEPPRDTHPRVWGKLSRLVGGLRELPFLLVIAGVGVGLVVVAFHHFKRGSIVIGAAVILGGVLRLALSERRAGLLVVRGRALDAATMIVLGVLIAVAAAIVPSP